MDELTFMGNVLTISAIPLSLLIGWPALILSAFGLMLVLYGVML